MTLEEALRFIDPETDMDALAEAEYYGGFSGTMSKPRRLSTMKAGRTREKSTAAS